MDHVVRNIKVRTIFNPKKVNDNKKEPHVFLFLLIMAQ